MVAGMATLFLLSVAAFGADRNVSGMISQRVGEILIVNSSQGKVAVVLAADTRVKDNKGLFGLGREEMAPTVLIPGLKVSVDGTTNSKGQVLA
jgi:hypothetical protein